MGRILGQFVWPHILKGNTEQSFIFTLDYQYDNLTKTWEGDFYFKVTDNFGIDKMDVTEIEYMYWIMPKALYKGFASWWLLQHNRWIHQRNFCGSMKVDPQFILIY
ncbi:MAG: hypothetical protein M3Q56_01290 [Bacteroidota bacterium]|nr:hypothetical protein [Bacteroidota bacterium]